MILSQKQKLTKLQVQNKNDNTYDLINDNNKQYKFTIYFYDIDYTNIINIYMSNELLDPNYIEYSTTYQFGPIGKIYGRKLTNKTIQDVIILETKDNTFYLQRYYG